MTSDQIERVRADARRLCERLGETITYRFVDGSELEVPVIVHRDKLDYRQDNRRALVAAIEVDVPRGVVPEVSPYGDGASGDRVKLRRNLDEEPVWEPIVLIVGQDEGMWTLGIGR